MKHQHSVPVRTTFPYPLARIIQIGVIPVALAVLTALTYFPSRYYDFQFDDLANIVKNFSVRSSSLWHVAFRTTRWVSQWLNGIYFHYGHYQPLLYRVGNITAHMLTGLLVYYVMHLAFSMLPDDHRFKRWGTWVATCTSGLFLVHPVATQTVSYVIQGQLEGLAALCSLVILVGLIQWSRATTTFSTWFWALVTIISCFIAPGTKEIAIITPLLALWIDWFFMARSVRDIRARISQHLAIAAIIWALYIYLLKPQYFTTILGGNMTVANNMGNLLTDAVTQKITASWYCISQFKVILHYIAIYFWPFGISADYDWKLVSGFWAPDCILPLILLCGIAGWLWYRLRRDPHDLIAGGMVWFFICILPRSSIVPGTELLADYKTYLASIGLFMSIALIISSIIMYLLPKPLTGRQTAILYTATAVVLGITGFGAYTRNKVWSSPQAFWLDVLTNAPRKARAYNNYGVSLCEICDYARAVPYFQEAIRLDSAYSDPHNNLAVAYGGLQQPDNAIASLQNSINICRFQPEAYNNMASFYIEKNDLDKAMELLDIAIKLRPHYGKAYFNRGRVYQLRNDLEQAYACFKQCCMHADFDTFHGFYFYGIAAAQTNRLEEALTAFQQALHHKPDFIQAIAGAGQVCLQLQQPERAHQYYAQLVALQPEDASAHAQMGVVLTVLKRPQEALSAFDRSLQLNPGFLPSHIHRAQVLASMGKKDQARQDLEQLLDPRRYTLAPDHRAFVTSAIQKL